jgi:hypothetical protein
MFSGWTWVTIAFSETFETRGGALVALSEAFVLVVGGAAIRDVVFTETQCPSILGLVVVVVSAAVEVSRLVVSIPVL